MDALRGAGPLARLLLAVGESGRDGDVFVLDGERRVRLGVAGGLLVEVTGVEHEPLGDTLIALGALDRVRHRELLGESAEARIGERLVAAGASSSAHVRRAVQAQLARAVSELLRRPGRSARFVARARSADVSTAGVAAALDLTSCVWATLISMACELPDERLAELAGEHAWVLTESGKRRRRGLLSSLLRGELERCASLGVGAAETVLARVGELPRSSGAFAECLLARAPREHRLLRALLCALGGVSSRPLEPQSYALLLRKRRELARQVGADALLDLPVGLGERNAGRALRKLAQKLHPDRFDASDPRLLALSNEVMSALARAEYELRARRV